MKKHQKHTALIRPYKGNFGRIEWTFIGAPCDIVHKFCQQLISDFKQYKIGFVDAAHQSDDQRIVKSALNYTDNISHHSIEWEGDFDPFKAHSAFNECDTVLVNGNHFKGKNQIVFIHPSKKESLRKKLDRLDNVCLFILMQGEEKIWDFLENDFSEVATIKSTQTESINNFFKERFSALTPALYGLVLAGGKSTRMGEDKSRIEYHGKPQLQYVQDLLKDNVEKVFTSVAINENKATNKIVDTFTGLGPFGGIVSAFREYPENAFLVLACDLPLVDEEAISYLISKRNPAKLATAFLNPDTGFADPLFTIWEPKAYMVMLQFLAQGYSCPRKVLINNDVELIDLPNVDWLKNVNTPEERAQFK